MELDEHRQRIGAWLDENAPPSLQGKAGDPTSQIWGGRKTFPEGDARLWLERCAEQGYTAPTWPKEYGGGGMSADEASILEEGIQKRQLPAPLIGFGLSMIGPVLLQYGTEEQKREHLPRIVRGEIRWCQGYSEPNAGSDLASLQCSAVPDGDHFVINGQKTWTSYADQADWMFLLVRTDPKVKKQQGITFIVVDMETPGIETKPIQLISGASPFCETFFEDVRVPVVNVISEINQGWSVAKALLGHERSMIANVFGSGQRSKTADRVTETARRYHGDDQGRIVEPILRDRLAALLMDQTCFRLTVQRTADAAEAGYRPGPETSLFKIYGTELNQRRHDLLGSMRGLSALGWEGEGFDDEEIGQTREWLRSFGNTIEGGTSEIQLNIIAKRVLGLPD